MTVASRWNHRSYRTGGDVGFYGQKNKESPAGKAGKGETGGRESVKHGKGAGLGLAETKEIAHAHFNHFRVCAGIEGKPVFAE